MTRAPALHAPPRPARRQGYRQGPAPPHPVGQLELCRATGSRWMHGGMAVPKAPPSTPHPQAHPGQHKGCS